METPETISIDEQATAAGRVTPPARDDIQTLSDTLDRFCDAQLPTSNALASARATFHQALYWLRIHRNEKRE